MILKQHLSYRLTYFIITLFLFVCLMIKLFTDFHTEDILSILMGVILFFVFFFVTFNTFFSRIFIEDGMITLMTLNSKKSLPISDVAKVTYVGRKGDNSNNIGFLLKDSNDRYLLRICFKYLYTIDKKTNFLKLIKEENPSVIFDAVVSDIEKGKNINDLSILGTLKYVQQEYENIKNDEINKK